MKASLQGVPAENWAPPVGEASTAISIDPRTVQRVPPGCKYAHVVIWADSLAPSAFGPCETNLVSVPDFTASNKHKALKIAYGSGLQIRFQYRPAAPGDRPGTVVVQTPSPLAAVDTGSVVTLIIARKVPSVLVPDVVATPASPSSTEAAVARLEAAQFRVIILDQQDGLGLPIGSVVSQSPSPGKPAPLGSVITISASGDYKGSIVPEITGLTVDEADRRLAAAGLTPQAINADGLLNPSDHVFSVEPSAGSKVPVGTKITLYVSPI